jgi:hypothetical protein
MLCNKANVYGKLYITAYLVLLWFKLILLNQALRIFKASTGIDELPWITAQSHTFAPA